MSGSQPERDLATALDACGYAAMRAPASGSATARDLPDVLASNGDKTLAVELKSTSSTTAYVDAAEVAALERFAERFGADAYLAANFKRPGGSRSRVWLVAPEDARVTDGGAYGLPEADIAERARYAVLPATDTKDAEVREV